MAPSTAYVINVMAADRPGIVAHIGARLHALGGSIHDLSQTVMGGYFTILLRAAFDRDVAPVEIETALQGGMPDLVIGLLSDQGETLVPPAALRLILTARGPDRPGLVAAIGTFLAGRDINIEDMYARAAPEGAGGLVMILQLACPPGRDLAQLQLDLAELAEDLGLTAHLQHENVFRATSEVSAVRALTV